ncbi:MAG: tyrosine-type recombinase/integrase [Nocardioides sp.]
MIDLTFDVRMKKISRRQVASGTRYKVRWVVSGVERSRTFQVKAMGDAYAAELRTAMSTGQAFRMSTGLPVTHDKSNSEPSGPTWLEHAIALVDVKWHESSAAHRKSTAEALVTITVHLTSDSQFHDPPRLRAALFHWAFNWAARRTSSEPPPEYAEAIGWVREHSMPLADLADLGVIRGVLNACATRLDGRPASASTAARKRAALSAGLVAAVEHGHLDSNPLRRVTFRRGRQIESIDPRTVPNPAQARAYLTTVHEVRPDLHALFCCLYYAALRPSEAASLTRRDLMFPETAGTWGSIILSTSYRDAGARWTDSGQAGEFRGLKHRATGQTRTVPMAPPLADALAEHLDCYQLGVGERLFVTRAGRAGVPLPPPYVRPISAGTVARVHQVARAQAFTTDQQACGLARRPYDLRHACVSTWLSAGVAAPQVAAWAGHSLAVLLRVYAHVVEGQQQVALERISQVLESSSLVQPKLP